MKVSSSLESDSGFGLARITGAFVAAAFTTELLSRCDTSNVDVVSAMAAKIGGGNHQIFLLYVSCIFCESAVENEVLLQKWRAKFLRDPSKTGFIAKSLLQTVCVKGPNAKKTLLYLWSDSPA